MSAKNSPSGSIDPNLSSIEEIESLCSATFRNVGEYLTGELSGTLADYALLDEMNKKTLTQYGEMKQTAHDINYAMQEINDKFKSLQSYLEKIDNIEKQVIILEQAAYKLDAYSKRLEMKLKELEKVRQT